MRFWPRPPPRDLSVRIPALILGPAAVTRPHGAVARRARIGIIVATTLITVTCGVAWITKDPLIFVALTFLPLILVIFRKLMDKPFDICLLFVCFSMFRIHEAFPVLVPFRIPNMLAILTISALAWSMFFMRTMKPYKARVLTLLACFLGHTLLGVFFAGNIGEAWAYWNNTFVKICMMGFSLAWLVRFPSQFARMNIAITLCGLLIAGVTHYNKTNGIGLVEETRVTIARDLGSPLGDPNDLSLVLLFPMAFAVSLAITSGVGKWSARLGKVAIPAIFVAIMDTQSRGGLLGIIAVFGVFALRKVKNKMLVLGAAAVLGPILSIAAGISGRSSGGASDASTADGALDESSQGRIEAWKAAFRMACVHPLNGVGLNNFLLNYWMYSDFWDGHNHAVHSTWFVVIAETGFPGIAMFMAMVVITAKMAYWSSVTLDRLNAPPPVRAIGQAMVAGLAGFCVSGTFLTQGFTWPIYIQIALTAAVTRYAKDFAAAHIEDDIPDPKARPPVRSPQAK